MLIERLMAKVVKLENGCEIFTGANTRSQNPDKAYGLIHVDCSTTMKLTHRVRYEIEVGPIPPGMVVHHECRNKLCCNPDHLKVMTQKENVRLEVEEGLWPCKKGENNGHAKLTAAQVEAIRADDRRQVDIAADYGISQPHVSRIKRGAAWDAEENKTETGTSQAEDAMVQTVSHQD